MNHLHTTRRTAIGMGAALLLPTALRAQTAAWPNRPIKIVVPGQAGSGMDIFARMLQVPLQNALKQPNVIENKAGANSLIGNDAVARSVPDGYTLLFTSYGYTANPVLRKNLPYTSASFRPEALLGSSPHIGAESFAKLTGIEYTHIPYKGQGPTMTDLTAGGGGAMFDGMSSYAQVKGGYVGAVAIAAKQRHPAAPEIPTFKDLDVDFVAGTWFGMLAPAGTADSVVAKINADMRQALQDEELKAQIAKTGLSVSTSSPEAFGQFLSQESAKLQNLVNQGAKIDLN
ncbi:MAG: tripartite tricarboxylate transporter substrate binding protein [Burkholderiaceae bacterium]|nr:tripartite tricarboxylate transporter substrate binding protein [Burkholderiaceae bacterium]